VAAMAAASISCLEEGLSLSRQNEGEYFSSLGVFVTGLGGITEFVGYISSSNRAFHRRASLLENS